MEDLYDLLGVQPAATPDEIKSRFRFLAQAYHPDKFASDEHRKQAEEQFKIISSAYQVLSDPEKRAGYDRERTAHKTHQRQETYEQSQQNQTSNRQYTYPRTPAKKADPKVSQPRTNKTSPTWTAIALMVTFFCLLFFLGLSSIWFINTSNTTTSYKTATLGPTATKIVKSTTISTLTRYPTPTSFPPVTITPTAISKDGQITISEKYPGDGKWEVSVDKILFEDELTDPIIGRVDKAQGRFAIIFIQVTNLGLSTDFFCACAEFHILDAEGNIYEQNGFATSSAQAIYELDSMNVNPDDTFKTIVVFDISIQSAYYILIPGRLYESEASGLLLDIP